MSRNDKNTMWFAAILCLACVLRATAAETNETGWKDVSKGITGPVFSMAAAPGSGEIVLGINKSNFLSSKDHGETWQKLGADDKEKIQNLATFILFDPKDPKIFWVSGAYGRSIYKTTDGGRSFKPAGPLWHMDNVSVDFSDPERKTMLSSRHESPRMLYRSTDGGKKWYNIGKRTIPEGTGIILTPIIIDTKTYVIGCNPSWMRGLTGGIYRTDDGAQSWKKVADFTPAGDPLTSSGGAIYWVINGGMIKSADKGITWEKVTGEVGGGPIEITGGKLVAFRGAQLLLSADGGKTWGKLGPAAPVNIQHVVFSEKPGIFYICNRDKGNKLCRWKMEHHQSASN